MSAENVAAGKLSKMVSGNAKALTQDFGKRLSRRQEKDGKELHKSVSRDEESDEDDDKAAEKSDLARKIAHRPSRVDLKLRNILRVDSSDSICASSENLDKSMNFEKRSQQLKSILKRRPSKLVLEELNILKSPDVDPSIAAASEKLKRAQIENTLENHLRARPEVEELVDRRLLFAEQVDVIPTFRKSEYNRKPDTNATFRKLTPQMKVQIREELNYYKKHEMPVHEHSLRNTCFH